MWTNTVQPGRPQMTIWRMRIACLITRATDTPSENVIFIALPRQPWLRERASILRYTYIACLVVCLRVSYKPRYQHYFPNSFNRLVLILGNGFVLCEVGTGLLNAFFMNSDHSVPVLLWRKWQWETLFFEYFALPVPVSFHQWSMLFFIHTFFSREQMVENCET